MAQKKPNTVVDEELIRKAYRKLKHYFYYDNMSLLYRKAIAEFESDDNFEENLNSLMDTINEFAANGESKGLDKLIDKITYSVFPKSFNDSNAKSNCDKKDDSFFYSNTSFKKEIKVDRLSYFIDAPIEIHIISVLWIMEEGYAIEDDKANFLYGNRLQLNSSKSGIINGLLLFKPYFVNYQRWRDIAIHKAKELVSGGTNVALIGLDIKDYYDSVELDFDKLSSNIVEKSYENKNIIYTPILKKIHKKYYQSKTSEESERFGLPIGLLSSSVIGNWHLKAFDISVKKKLRPIYYGRYVDDILIVLSDPDIQERSQFKKELFQKYFIDNDIFEIHENGFKLSGYHNLSIQQKKVSLMYFQANEPVTLLNKFQEELKRNSSEFRFLPDEDQDTFEVSAHTVNYSGSKLKLRSIANIMNNKFGASRFLIKKIIAATQIDMNKDDITTKQLLTYFKGERMIEFYSLWEKVLSYFVLTKNKEGIYRFLGNFEDALESLDINKQEIKKEKDILESTLKSYFNIALYMALSLEGEPLKDKFIKKILKNQIIDGEDLIKHLRKSNMVRHNYVSYPLLNYTKESTEQLINLINKD